ncbi:methyltransferase domain-containing protein [Anoxybacillus rupiensis]|jgi:23S rRNA (guanine745-N1)-methyltransferase|uniref:Methyltransferase domain-containing protein n=1 Tax=Anoxybacteroides rupiense TaxID=311460 RepID=A0ABD5IYJ4_9BACL|nr:MULTISPECIES: methyltransferase domain-containing protein [Anoxybacillus]KXG09516.1 23S rRNA (guanine(745)-N(1))-methyltransferase [Anoxybacillus sp. P3H1B]MBB3908866.1 23S rRNA (guanine745-N1)-methyltransferase [Anoxybacillus rupiensis]MDE8565060.1 methyltransferase domain-containing protein [Anoxybacillus rupiensis]MED5052810.1 methyltransferase domain-containing protein [Anoxybacillus rupiensis]
MSNKKRLAAQLMAASSAIFRCPVCSAAMELQHVKSLECINRHTFDLSKVGYVNLFTHSPKVKYEKQMFEARHLLCQAGLFAPMNQVISDYMIHELVDTDQVIKLLDAGCGEGSHLFHLKKYVERKTASRLLGVGIDLAKEGVYIAAREYPNLIWCVADIANCPFRDRQFHFIMNILSPANYAEFQRVLMNGGTMIKVVPGKQHLQEIREYFYGQTARKAYTNDRTIQRFQDDFRITAIERVTYKAAIAQEWMAAVIQMTPLSWGIAAEKQQQALRMEVNEITMDLTILFGKK